MEGSVAVVEMSASPKADLRNVRTLLGLFDGDRDDRGRPLARLVHDITVGHRHAGAPSPRDLDELRRCVDEDAVEVARERRVADDTLRHLARSFERVLAWWRDLPEAETLLDERRWPADLADLAIELDDAERARVLAMPSTREAIRSRFEKYVSKCPAAHRLRLVHGAEAVLTLVAERGHARVA